MRNNINDKMADELGGVIELEPKQKDQVSFALVGLVAWVACGALTEFSFFSSAMDYHRLLGRTDVAGSRVLGLQTSIVVFWMLATLLLLMTARSRRWAKLGCLVGATLALIVGSVQSVDSTLTSFGYQSHKLGSLTGSDRAISAKLDTFEDRFSEMKERQTLEIETLNEQRERLIGELNQLDAIIAPAVASGTNLKSSYSRNRDNLSTELQGVTESIAAARSQHMEERVKIGQERTRQRETLAASNASGVTRAARFVGLSPENLMMGKTLACELSLVALAMMLGVTAYYGTVGSRKEKQLAYVKIAAQVGALAVIFAIAYAQFVSEAERVMAEGGYQETTATVPAVPVITPLERTEPDTTLLGPDDWFGDDGLPQAAVDCPIPADVFEAIVSGVEDREERALYAATAYKESTWRPELYHYDNDGGHAHGLYCLHGRWRKKDVAWMKAQPGGWKDPLVNLRAFQRCLEDHEAYWPKTKISWREKLAHYNGGSRPNYRYADSIIKHAKELQKWFS